MRRERIIFLVVTFWSVLIAGACSRHEAPELSGDENAICFEAGIELIRSDEPSTRALNTATSFTSGAKINIFGRRTGEGRNTRIFYKDDSANPAENHQYVTATYGGGTTWTYSPLSYWYWVNDANYYDFIAVHPETAPAERMIEDGEDIPGYMAVKSLYNIPSNPSEDYDLLMAATRRYGYYADRTSPVNLVFEHMLCAVKVVITNKSESMGLTLTSIGLDNLIQSAYAKMTIDSQNIPEYYWIDSQRTNATLSLFSGSQAISSSGTYSTEFRLLIPGDLADTIDGTMAPEEGDLNYATLLTAYEGKVPHLKVTFTYVDPSTSETVACTPPPVMLKDIQRASYGDDDPISFWEPGIRYTYYIDIRLDGGVVIRVVTTEWDEIEAETPGLLID